jgi:quaternary ammonium compound-resistance protein SugE
MKSAWSFLVLAGLFEVAWAIGLKYTQGFTRPLASVLTIAGMVISFFLLSRALASIPIGTAYAIWTGIGAAGTVLVAAFLFREPLTALRVTCIVLIVAGIVGLKWTSGS